MIDTELISIDYAGDGTSSQSLGIPFYAPHNDTIYVWAMDSDGVLTRKNIGDYYNLTLSVKKDASGYYGYVTPTTTFPSPFTIRIQRVVEMTQLHAPSESVSTSAIERMLDYTTIQNQQLLTSSAEDYRKADAKNNRISDLPTPLIDLHVANKDYAISVLGDPSTKGVHSGWTIASANVGKFAGSNGLSTPWWTSFNGYPDTTGQWFKYLTPNGWKEFTDTPAPTSDDNYLLMDVSGTPTWSQIYEVPDPSVPTAYEVLERTNATEPATYGWRDNGFLPVPLPTMDGQFVHKHATEGRNVWSDIKIMTGKAAVTFSGDYTGVTGSGGAGAAIQSHRVWLGSMNIRFEATPVAFFASCDFVESVAPNKLWFDPNTEGTIGEPSWGWCPGSWSHNLRWTPTLNIGAISATSVTLTATSPLHKFLRMSAADIAVDVYDFPSTVETVVNWLAVVDIS